jgi:hypothetical protein
MAEDVSLKISHNFCFDNFINIKSKNEWYLDNIPPHYCKSIVDGEESASWSIYWHNFKYTLDNSKVKPKIININKNVFWQFFEDLIKNHYQDSITVYII